MKTCPSCNSSIPNAVTVCRRCGATIRNDKAQRAAGEAEKQDASPPNSAQPPQASQLFERSQPAQPSEPFAARAVSTDSGESAKPTQLDGRQKNRSGRRSAGIGALALLGLILGSYLLWTKNDLKGDQTASPSQTESATAPPREEALSAEDIPLSTSTPSGTEPADQGLRTAAHKQTSIDPLSVEQPKDIAALSRSKPRNQGAAVEFERSDTQIETSYFYVTNLDPNGDNWLALKEAPDLYSGRIEKLTAGTLLEVTGAKVGRWVPVQTITGRSGWVFDEYIACCKDADQNNTIGPSGSDAEPTRGKLECDNASSRVERMICDRPELAHMDQQLEELRLKANALGVDPEELSRITARGIQLRSRCGLDAVLNPESCIRIGYEHEQDALRQAIELTESERW